MAKRSDEDQKDTRVSGARNRAARVAAVKPVPAIPSLADENDDEEDPDIPRHRPENEPLSEEERGFGRYTLLRRLAYGGMGEIFLARQGGQGSLSDVAKLVVIKRILSHMKRDEKHRRMFLDEARLQALLNSQYVVHVHDMGEENGHVYLAMEHVHGPSWRAVIDRMRQLREQIPVVYVCQMVAQAARGLSYAHNLIDVTGQALKIVHRDINPHNVLVSYDGDVKIIDFGIAKSELGTGHTETGTIKGKFQYMSPEQSAAERLDKRSDIFTLGICLYELLALDNPFRRANVVLSLEAIQKEQIPPIERKRRDAAPLEPILKRCLNKHRADRFGDAADLADELEAIAESGLLPQPAAPLSVWLRERFSVEIAEHLQILEATGSQGAMVTRGRSNPSALPKSRAGSRPTSRPTSRPGARPATKNPVDDPTNPNHDGVHSVSDPSLDLEILQEGYADDEPTAALPPGGTALESAPTALFAPPSSLPGPLPGPLPHDLTATTPAPARLSDGTSANLSDGASGNLSDEPSANLPVDASTTKQGTGVLGFLIAASAVAALMGAVVVFLLLDPARTALVKQRTDALLAWAGLQTNVPVPVPVPVPDPVAVPDPLPVPDPTATPDAGPAASDPVPDPVPVPAPVSVPVPDPSADPVVVPDPVPDPVPVVDATPRRPDRKRPRDPPPNDVPVAEPEPGAKAIAGTLLVTTDGYFVKGNRKLPKSGATSLKIEGAPFAVTLRVQDGAPATVTLSSEPWAIVTVDNVGRGRSPQSFTLAPGKRVSLTLKNPTQPQMVLSLQLVGP